jgi:ketosteroid isomerase-like protein
LRFSPWQGINLTQRRKARKENRKNMNEIIQAFIDCINTHDVDGLAGLMSDDHTFIDAHGNGIVGRETMVAGWRGYFDWFPDYYIEVTDVFENDDTFAMFGLAGGSFKGKESEAWRLPAAWKAIVKDGRVALWQVFADTKIPFEIMERNI